MKRLYEILEEYGQSNIAPFHMPGHKRNIELMPDWNPWKMDFTEVEGLDNMHCAEGIIKEAQERLAKIYGAKASYFMVNGSTGGILAAISSCVKHGDSIVVARNCHKSVYNAIYLNELKPVYVYPKILEDWEIFGGITPAEVERAVKANPQVKAVVITSPTYEGIVSDVRAIAEIAHKYSLPLIVDEAHGAHMKLMKNCPESAVDCGADIVIQSFHKLLPALTQTAVLHFNSDIADRQKLENYLGIYQTSSPSYLFMASMDWALDFMQSDRGKSFAREYWQALNSLKEKVEKFKNLRIMGIEIVGRSGVFGFDATKLMLAATNQDISGSVLEEKLLKEFGIQIEMSKGRNVLLMTSIADGQEVFGKLGRDLEALDAQLDSVCKGKDEAKESALEYRAQFAVTCYEAVNSQHKQVPLEAIVGKISAEYVYLYPPGIPMLVPGEFITEELYKIILYYKDNYSREGDASQRRLQGMQDRRMNSFLVVDNSEEK